MATINRHDLDDARLGKYLLFKLPYLKLPIVSTKIGYGQSNPTYFVDDAACVVPFSFDTIMNSS